MCSHPNHFASKLVHFQMRSLQNPFASKSVHFKIYFLLFTSLKTCKIRRLSSCVITVIVHCACIDCLPFTILVTTTLLHHNHAPPPFIAAAYAHTVANLHAVAARPMAEQETSTLDRRALASYCVQKCPRDPGGHNYDKLDVT